MAKNPFIKFYIGDYIKDTRILPLNVRGAWVDLILFMWENHEKGEVQGTVEDFSRLMCCSTEEANLVIQTLKQRKIFDYVDMPDGVLKIISRKQKDMIKLSQTRSESGKNGGNPALAKPKDEILFNQNDKQNSEYEYEYINEFEMNFLYGRVPNFFFGAVPEELVEISKTLLPTEKADEWHDYVEDILQKAGYKTKREVAVEYDDGKKGRLDLVATKPGVVVAIELDYRTPRAKSLAKVKTYPCGMVLLRDPKVVKIWNQKPGEQEMDLKLPKIKAGAVLELLIISGNSNVTAANVQALWGVFKAQNFTSQKFYHSENDVFSHFINWSKTQKINGTHQQPSVKRDKSSGARQVIKLLQDDISTDGIRKENS